MENIPRRFISFLLGGLGLLSTLIACENEPMDQTSADEIVYEDNAALVKADLINDAAGPCGTKEGKLAQMQNRFLIPDYFPPDSSALRVIFETSTGYTLGRCENLFGRASLKSPCENHDRCYEVKGANKDQCDAALQDQWSQKCKSQYANVCLTKWRGRCIVASPDNPLREVCRNSCVAFVHAMYEALRINLNGWCPSCDAYNQAQRK